MELPGIFRGLGDRISRLKGRGVTVEPAPDPQTTVAMETAGKGMLVRLYIDPAMLESLGAVGRTMGAFMREGKKLTRMEEGFGLNTNVVPHLTANLRGVAAEAIDPFAQSRELALSLIATDRRTAIEGEVLLEAQRRLREKLQEEGLNGDYRAGATEMLKRIEAHLRNDIALTGENPH